MQELVCLFTPGRLGAARRREANEIIHAVIEYATRIMADDLAKPSRQARPATVPG